MTDSVYLRWEDLPWRDTPHAGVRWKKLHFSGPGRTSSVLLEFEAGASYGAHRHPAGEEYLVLRGSLEDGGKTWTEGSYVRHAAGSVHCPSSREGCLLFVTLPEPIEPV